ncbi:hypothetical protein NECAME_11652 [Necator americanus]|uniref:G-protein coupled receptors family 1 profile domain-containing protein n=1 Tax=Necator americanus TaxID=51031 RepID=W2T651_NECAM|nr:hypothetical protein NECAME_11652 [Necator americanus]ETN76452.1 hypothetical protein NECAME_11652 [Necator americanus]
MLPSDAVAGLSLLLFGIVGVCLFGLVTYSMLQMIGEIVGFRFLISQAVTDILLLIQFAVWPGITILCQNEILPVGVRWHVHIYLDFTWWAMVYHYTVVAWSRWAAVQWPNWFRVLPSSTCFCICAVPWLAGLTQSIVEHQFDWFVPLYFNPERYGMDSDWARYNGYGTNTYYMICNVVLMVLPFPLYAAALIKLFRRQTEKTISEFSDFEQSENWAPYHFIFIHHNPRRQMSIETRLLVPCIINTILFVVGQIFISQCSKHGKWMNWAVMVVFTANSLVNPLLYLFFSSVIRKGVVTACRDRLTLSAIYDYELRSSSGEQRASLIRMNRDATFNSQLNRIPASR